MGAKRTMLVATLTGLMAACTGPTGVEKEHIRHEMDTLGQDMQRLDSTLRERGPALGDTLRQRMKL